MKKAVCILCLILSLNVYADEDETKKNDKIETSAQYANVLGCSVSFRNLWIAAGVAGGAGVIGGTGMFIAFLNSGEDGKTTISPTEFPEIKKPESLNRKIDSIELSTERIQTEKDAARYLENKFGGNEKLATPLARFCERYPVEAREALIAESLLERADPRTAGQLLEAKGTETYFVLLYAWVITHQFNRSNHSKDTTYAEVVSEVEKEIRELWPKP